MKTINPTLIILAFLLSLPAYGQIKSNKYQVQITTGKIKRGMPPILFAELNYHDDNGNGILESNENSTLTIKIFNKGKGKAQRLEVLATSDTYDKDLIIKDKVKIPVIEPGESKTVTIPINANLGIKTQKHKIRINVTEHFRYDMDPAYLVLQTRAFQKPELVFAGMQIYDSGEGTAALNEDGQLQAGELAKIKVLVQNVGNNVARDVNASITSNDENIYLEKIAGTKYHFDEIKIGEVKEIWFVISPNKVVKSGEQLPVYVMANNKYGYGNLNHQLPLMLGVKPPETEILEVHADVKDLEKNVAKFEYSSKSFTSKLSDLVNVEMVEPIDTVIPNSVGVIVGIENYKHLPAAPYAVNDAKLMEEYFKKRLGVEQVVIFTENEASGFFFDDVFNPEYGELHKAVVEEKTDLFVFYSGHGIPAKDGKFVYLFPQDGKVERLDKQGYELSKFYGNLDKLGAKSITVFLDACFSGASRKSDDYIAQNLTGEKGVIIKPRMPRPWESNPNFTVFTSSTGGQTSLGYDESKTGLFSYYLMAGLQGKADANKDSLLTMKELKNYVIKNVSKTSKKISGLQTPEFHGNEDMVLFDYRKNKGIIEEEK